MMNKTCLLLSLLAKKDAGFGEHYIIYQKVLIFLSANAKRRCTFTVA
jgi:hypothetical protein